MIIFSYAMSSYYFDPIQAKNILKGVSKNLNEDGGIILGMGECLRNTTSLCRHHEKLIIYTKIH